MPRVPSISRYVERLFRWSLERRGHRARHVSTEHGRLHVYDARGTGPLAPMVMLHGIGSTASAFGPILKHSRRRMRRVTALEYLGHGFSDVPNGTLTPSQLVDSVTSVLDSVIDEPAVLFGNSLGGGVAMHYAIARPDRVRALILVSPAGAPLLDGDIAGIRKAFDLTTRREAQRFLERVYHVAPWYAPLLAHEALWALGKRAVRDLIDALSNEHAPDPVLLRALPMPVLLIWGASERLFPRSCLEWYRAHLPAHATIEETEGFGHSPHLEQSAAVADRIVSFVRDLPRR